jgi:hypothetical protein
MHDDAQLASNIFNKSFADLFRPLDLGNQAAPVGFLVLQKASILIFGRGELAIRLVPFLASVAVLPLFFIAFRKIASAPAALLAVTWLALAEPLVNYAAQGKQYSTDVLWTMVAIALAIGADMRRRLVVLTVAGAILIWFSHPLLFVLAGIGMTLFVQHLLRREKQLVTMDVIMGAVWLGSFALNYLAISRYYAANDYLTTYWANLNAFAPAPSSGYAILWYPRALAGLFDYPLGIWTSGNSKTELIAIIAVAVFIAGCIILAWRHARILGFVVAILLLTIAASVLRRYPFGERLILFTAPLVVMPLAIGAGARWKILPLQCLVVVPMLIYPAYLQAKYAIHPLIHYDIKPAMRYLRANWQPGDVLYLHWGSDVLGRYYLETQPSLAIPGASPVRGVFVPELSARSVRYAADLQRVQGHQHVWIIFSMDPDDDRAIYERILNQRGRLIQKDIYPGGAAELYDLSGAH